MTYRELLDVLRAIEPERLDDTVTVYEPYDDEYIAVVGIGVSADETNDVLDPGHIYLIMKS